MSLSSFVFRRLGRSNRCPVLRYNSYLKVAALPGVGEEFHPRTTKRCFISSKTSSSSSSSDKGATTCDTGSDGSQFSGPLIKKSMGKNKKIGCSQQVPQVEQRFKRLKRKEWGQLILPFSSTSADGGDNSFESNFIKPSSYLYSPIPASSSSSSSTLSSEGGRLEQNVLYSMDASPYLDPQIFLKRPRQPFRDASRSINGLTNAKRLLYSKKNLTTCLMDWMSPEPMGVAPLPSSSLLSSSSSSSSLSLTTRRSGHRHRQMIPRQYLCLEGHGVPPDLFQHFIDMGYAFLQNYGDHTESCSFHNFYNFDHNHVTEKDDNGMQRDNYTPQDFAVFRRLIPEHVFTRAQNGAIKSCVKRPGHGHRHAEEDGDEWDHRLALYLTVMERLVRELGGLMDRSINLSHRISRSSSSKNDSSNDNGGIDSGKRRHSKAQLSSPPSIQDYDYDHDDTDLSSSSQLFPSSNYWKDPRWSVDILRRKELILEPLHSHDGSGGGLTVDNCKHVDQCDVAPFPIVEFIPPMTGQNRNQSPSLSPYATSRNVTIRLQGNARDRDAEFAGHPPSHRFVTLVLTASPSSPSRQIERDAPHQ